MEHRTQVEGSCDMTEEMRKIPTSVFAVRTTAGQEKNVAGMIAIRVETAKLPIKAVLVPEMMKGYVFVEAEGPHFVEQAISGIKHVRSRVPGLVTFSEVERYIVVKPVIEELSTNDIVEIVGGPFKGMRAKINEVTKDYAGMKVPVKVTVDPETKEFEVTVGTPTTSALIVSELKIEKGSGSPKTQKVGDLNMEQAVKIARMKSAELLSPNLKAAVKEVLGSCVSMGITVDGKDPREVQKEIDQGKHDSVMG